MKKYKVKDVLQMLEKDGWYLARTKGDHRQLKHPTPFCLGAFTHSHS